MSKLIYSTSATIYYLMHIEKMTMKDIRILIGERLATVRRYKEGKVDFTKQNYLDIIKKFPQLEAHIEYFENVKDK